jgi:hypothetical protein
MAGSRARNLAPPPARLAAALAALGLAGCVPAPGSPYRDLAYQRVVPGARLTLLVPLEIPARQAHVDVQGSWVGQGASETDPYCSFEIETVSESPQWVEPDVFEIWRVGRSISPSSDWGQWAPVMLAGLDLHLSPQTVVDAGTGVPIRSDTGARVTVGTHVGIGVGFGSGASLGLGGGLADVDPPSQLFYKTRFWLRSARQPQVRLLLCQWDQMTPSGAALARHLTLAEIRWALGSTFTLTLPGEPAGR